MTTIAKTLPLNPVSGSLPTVPRSTPVPFFGGKVKAVDAYVQALLNLPEATDVYDLFGGSGLLSVIAKRILPDARVYYNDYDEYTTRLAYAASVAFQNVIRALNDIRKRYYLPASRVVTDPLAAEGVRTIIRDEMIRVREAKGDYYLAAIRPLLLGMICFSGRFDASDPMKNEYCRVYCRWPLKPYSDVRATSWTNGLTVYRKSVRDMPRLPDNPSTILVIDPPYPDTLAEGYSDSDWTLSDYNKLVQDVLATKSAAILFGNEKSGIHDLMQRYIDEGLFIKVEYTTSINQSATEVPDFMYFRHPAAIR